MRLRTILFSFFALAISVPTSAQTRREAVWSFTVGYASDKASPVEGLAVTGSYAKVFGFVRPALYLEGIAYDDGSSPYYYDSFDNGDGQCRSSGTGRYVDSSLCGPSWQFAARAEGLLRVLHTSLLAGPGVRVGSGGITPYGTLMYETRVGVSDFTVLQIKGSIGREYIQADLGIGLSL